MLPVQVAALIVEEYYFSSKIRSGYVEVLLEVVSESSREDVVTTSQDKFVSAHHTNYLTVRT